MIFLNFLQLSESVFPPNFSGKHFPENQAKLSFYWKVFSMTNFPTGKQTQESLESDFPETTFRKTNTAKGKTLSWKPSQIFLWLESVFRWLESVFRWSIFLMTNKHRKIWKIVSRKLFSRKQTWQRLSQMYLFLFS